MESGRGEGAECLLIEVREREREGGGGVRKRGETCIYAALHADKQAVLCFLSSSSQGDSLSN